MPTHADLFNPARNRILSALPRAEFERLRPRLEYIRLRKGKVLFDVGDPVRHAYFLTSGMVSLLSAAENGSTVEVGMVGNEGLAGLPAVLRVETSPYRVMVQLPGAAIKVGAVQLRDAFERGVVLRDLLLRYTHAVLTQVSQSAVCNRFHTVEQRLCRWLLVTRDRINSDSFGLTQEFIAHMLGVPRTSVTAVAGALQREGLISYRRGQITITDARRLNYSSCECYRVLKRDVDRFLAA